MKRRSPALLAGLVIGGTLLLVWNESGKSRHTKPAPQVEVSPPPPAPEPAEEDAPDPTPAELLAATPPPNGPTALAKRFQTMPDGSPVPALSSDAPQRVKLGIALFRYEGAEAPPKSTRSKEEALKLAEAAAQSAQSDFAAAVKSGDRGSSENLGWIDRGILEPAVEYAVFSLKKGEVTPKPIDSPRGFWVARRIR